jgi:hypothetical protein
MVLLLFFQDDYLLSLFGTSSGEETSDNEDASALEDSFVANFWADSPVDNDDEPRNHPSMYVFYTLNKAYYPSYVFCSNIVLMVLIVHVHGICYLFMYVLS